LPPSVLERAPAVAERDRDDGQRGERVCDLLQTHPVSFLVESRDQTGFQRAPAANSNVARDVVVKSRRCNWTLENIVRTVGLLS
jgi:hypothetical protein